MRFILPLLPLLFIGFCNPALPAQTKLTLKQVLELIPAVPDTVVANEIRRRGLNAPVTAPDVARLQKAGAGPQTLRTVRLLIVTQPLVITSNQPGSQVIADNKPAGLTDSSGHFTIGNLEPGSHHILVQKTGYTTADLTVSLTAGKSSEVRAQLQRNMGLITVTTNAPQSQIEIEGLPGSASSVLNRELPPGSYSIHVTAPRFLPATKTVTVQAGDALNLAIPLQLDPAFARTLLTKAFEEAKNGNLDRAATLAQDVLRIEPNNGPAYSLIATRDFYTGDYNGFRQFGLRALQNGGELDIPVVHHHTFRSIHRAILKLRANGIAYDPNGQPGVQCNQPAFDVPLSSLRAVDIRQDPNGQRFLLIKVVDPRSNRQQSLLFADYRATIVNTGGRIGGVLEAPPDGPEEITALGELIQQEFRNAH
ncbi:MAG: PEGA domain-containing protein [Acidobacteriota bacterium]|nr:PEGA domain-containing protein [Acidobacteriota bacterium]